MNQVSAPNEYQRRVLEEARTVVAEVGGKRITHLDKALLHRRTSGRPEDRTLQLKAYEEAFAADHAWREAAVMDLVAYKQHWGPIFMQRRLLGRKLPDVYPDPEDIAILSPTEFRFKGPVTAEEAAQWEYMMKGREAFFFVANEIIEAAGLFKPLEEDHQRYWKLRRSFYRINRLLPKEFKKKHPAKFPAFNPPAEPPEWYSDVVAGSVSRGA